jgi:hypothetical protein
MHMDKSGGDQADKPTVDAAFLYSEFTGDARPSHDHRAV